MLDISYAADKIGLRTLSVEATMADLRDRVVLPAIIHWDNHHFIVVYKVTKQKVYVSDPAKGLILQAFLPFISKAVIDTGIRTQDVNFVYMVLAANIVLLLSITLSNVLRDWVFVFLKVRRKLDWEYFDILSKDCSYWVETISNIQEIKINNYEDTKRWKWEGIQARLYKLNVKILNINNAQMLGSQFINSMQNMAVTFFCAIAVINGDITFGIMISTQFIIGMLNGPVAQFVGFVQSAQYAKISFMRINEIHKLEDEDDMVSISANSMDLPKDKSLNVKNLSFAYSPNAPIVLKGIYLTIPEGKVTAIVGDSGCGKSTLLKLLLRLYLPSYGEICIGDMNINNVSLRQWRTKCGCVMQEGKVFNDTIQNNIVLNEEKVDYDALKRATDIANISKEIEAMPQGYQTMIGEMGRGLSGGQKQRLLIARALYKNPDYLFLDEATNALDTINEQKIVAALNNVFKNRTVIVIAHRLSTIKKADQIVVMKGGMIVELGNHNGLMERRGQYYELIQSQYDLEPVEITA